MRSSRSCSILVPLLLMGGVLGCESGPDPLGPDEDLHAKGGKNGGEPAVVLVADATGDVAYTPSSTLLESTCPGEVMDSYAVLFRHSGCLIVTTTPTTEGVSAVLTDDVSFQVKVRKNKILQIRVVGQDVIGTDGIQHESDWHVFDEPVPADPAGFVLHVHARDLPVWRLSGHIGGGRVEMVGTVDIGDLVYRAQP